MLIPGLTRSTIQEHTSGGSFHRGERYVEEGAVQQLEVHQGAIRAHVQGGYYLPYTVRIRYDSDGITDVQCSCPYHEGSWCKHIVATLLACLEQSEESSSLAAVESLLKGKSRDELVALIERLAARDPRILNWIEEEQASSP